MAPDLRIRGALGGTRTPNLLIRSQMLYPLSYERSHCSILHLEPSRRVLEACARPYSGDRASDFLIAIELRRTSAAAHPKLSPDPSKPWPAWVSIPESVIPEGAEPCQGGVFPGLCRSAGVRD